MCSVNASFHRYFSASNADRQWGFFVTSVGRTSCQPGAVYPPQQHPAAYQFEWSRGRTLEDFALIAIVAGEGFFEARKTPKTHLRRGDTLLLPPGLLHRYRPDPGTGWEEYWVTFDGDIPRRWLAAGLLDEQIPVAGHNSHLALIQTFEELLTEARRPVYPARQLAAFCHLLLSEALAGPGKHEQDAEESEETRLRHAADTLKRHPAAFDLHALAAAAGMGQSTFRRKFALHFGATPARFAQQERMSQAKRWLAETSLPIRAIADKLAFCSEFYFMRAFKRETGTTPGAWRKKDRSIS